MSNKRPEVDIERYESERKIKNLIKILIQGDDDTSWKAAQALGRIKSTEAVIPLIKAECCIIIG